MENKPKNLGLNCSAFEDFITGNRIYVDKTNSIYKLITAVDNRHFYFISRPRRFGKTLFISTLKAIFLGKKELFSGYWIGKESDYDWQEHPVIHLDFGGIDHGSPEEFKQSLFHAIKGVAKEYSVVLQGVIIADALNDLVKELSKKNKVVLLIDEYDKPLVDHIGNPSLIEANRKILNSFYTTVKSLDVYWRAIFITGVSKFSRTSLFSGLNNLLELTLDPSAAELFGYTYDDLITYFALDIDNFASHVGKMREEIIEDMKGWYNGYRFSKDMQKPLMYNPLSVVASLKSKEFCNYWFSTGTPGFLIALLRSKGIDLEISETIKVSIKTLDAIDINNIPLFTLLVQTGYLTIVDYDAKTGLFTLDYPNREVRESFKDYLMLAFAYTTPDVLESELIRMRNALDRKDFALFCNAVKTLFAGIPYNLHVAREAYYHSLFHFMFDLLGMRPWSEVASSKGKADLVLETVDAIIVFEFKYDECAQEALDQINRKKYHEQYIFKNKALILVGINFCFKDKELTFEWVQANI